ncbi:MAG: protein BatD [Bacteroidaceae bacterium]|nr:protein BatD [Bacteroidaceae bacterium]
MKKHLILFLLSIIASVGVFADDIQFTASAPKAVVKGEQFRVSYTVTTQKVKEFRAPSFDGFEVLMGPSTSRSNSTSIVNGEVTSTSTITYTYILLGVEEGEHSIPGASIVADGDKKTSNSLTINVLPPDKTTGGGNQSAQGRTSNAASSTGQISSNDLFITATVNKTNAYEQEAILLTYKVYFTVNLRELEIKMPDLKGFLTQEVDLQRGQPTLEHYNGRNYNTIVWSQYVLFPQQAGKLEIPSIDFDATVAVRTQRSVDPFDVFFNGGTSYVDVRKTISTPKLTVNVSPLPAGKPASFMGGVGEFDMKSSITTTELKANEAVTLKLEISGVGNLKLVTTPEVDFPQDFETYDPKVDNKFTLTRNGLSGKKVIEYLAIPRHAGTFTIPSIEFSYFDLKSKSYKTLSTEPYELNVAKGEGASEQVVSNFTNKEDVRLIGQDIRYIKTGSVTLIPKGQFLFGSWVYYVCYIVPLLLLVVVVVIYRKRAIDSLNVSKVRNKNANKMAVKRLKLAAKLLKESKQEAFYEEVLKALWGYISDKMNIPVAHLSKDNVEQQLMQHGVDKALSDEFLQLLNECEFARYAPSSVAGGMDKVYAAAIEVISRMDNSIKRMK